MCLCAELKASEEQTSKDATSNNGREGGMYIMAPHNYLYLIAICNTCLPGHKALPGCKTHPQIYLVQLVFLHAHKAHSLLLIDGGGGKCIKYGGKWTGMRKLDIPGLKDAMEERLHFTSHMF